MSSVKHLRGLEPIISDRSVKTAEQLLELVKNGTCTGFAFVALLRGGRYARGYTGETVQQPELTLGILERIRADLLTQSDNNSRVLPD